MNAITVVSYRRGKDVNEEENANEQEKENDGDGGLLIPSYLHVRDTRVRAWQRHLPRMYRGSFVALSQLATSWGIDY